MWEFVLLVVVVVGIIGAMKCEDDREYRRDRERRGIREDD